MDELKVFIQSWETDGDIARILEKGLALPPAEKVQSYLASLPEAESLKIRSALEKIMSALDHYATSLERETAAIKEKLDQSRASAKACLSYDSADVIHRKK